MDKSTKGVMLGFANVAGWPNEAVRLAVLAVLGSLARIDRPACMLYTVTNEYGVCSRFGDRTLLFAELACGHYTLL